MLRTFLKKLCPACKTVRKERVLILGAAGRDFQNFNTYFKKNDQVEVVGFTATQIPKIEGRQYPPVLAGDLYPKGLQIWSENELEKLVESEQVDRCILAYSDLNHKTVMDIASRVLATGADFGLMGTTNTWYKSTKPVIAITATRTGCGKSQTTRYVVDQLKSLGLKVSVVRHPMPYGDLAKQAVQRFETYDDLIKHDVTIEEREEYESHIDNDTVVFAGVDYEAILREAEKESDVVMWDGGNNDTPFFQPDLWAVVADPLRPGHELDYYPGAVNARAADVVLINKANTATKEQIEIVKKNLAMVNPEAKVILGSSTVTVDNPEAVKGKKVLLVDDGPTMTHGEMEFGAGKVAADRYEAAGVVDPRKTAAGTIQEVYKKYPHLGAVLPAMGYFPEQIKDLEDSINNTPGVESVLIATPMDLRRLINIEKPVAIAKYALEDMEGLKLSEVVADFLKENKDRLPETEQIKNL
eukprot:TRINITY_DN777924_c0_g1_i1.p1 TRINITY_DN777924_c0_g1~~TRINITY_DN777924_c0_g1_i1.p1  ORF type:complete len:479 (-),score=117.56 TRINITY_DN777924_c0_g1_i1:687-2096(-)